MFKNLRETIMTLNADVNNVANSEKATNLRRKLLRKGIPMAIGGFLGVFICFILFVTAGDSAFGDNGFTARVIIPFILFIPCGLLGSIGMMITMLGLKIVVTGYTTGLIKDVVSVNCPNCGINVNGDMNFCPKCGTKVKNVCPNCGHATDVRNAFCEKCGTKF